MPTARWEDVASFEEEQSPQIASFDDIASFETPAPAQRTNVASFDDIASVETPAPRNVASFADIASVEPAPKTPAFPRSLRMSRTAAEATAPLERIRPLTISRTAAEAMKPLATTPPWEMAPEPPTILQRLSATEPQILPAATEVVKGGLQFAKQLVQESQGLNATRVADPTILETTGKFVDADTQRDIPLDTGERPRSSSPTILEGVASSVRAGVQVIREASHRAMNASSPQESSQAAWEAVSRAASLPVDVAGIPVSEIRDAVGRGDYGRAIGLTVGTGVLIGGFEAVHKVGGRLAGAVPEARVPSVKETRDAVTAGPKPGDDLGQHPRDAEVRPPAEAGSGGVAGERPPTSGVAHVDDIVEVVQPPAEPPRPVPPEAAPAVDTLTTGERQPRLPGDVGEVRDREVATPAATEAPFSLEREAAPASGVQPPLREEPAPPAPPKKEPRGVRAAPAEWRDVVPAERRELRRIVTELESLPYEPKRFTEGGRGRGGELVVSGGAGGAPVYWDIVGGNPDAGRPTFRYSRGEVLHKLRAFVQDGKRSRVSDLAVDVARRRQAGERGLTAPSLPPSAGDTGAIDVPRLTNLAPEQAAVQDRTITAVERHPDAFVDLYREKFGNVVNADQVKELFDDFARSPEARTANDVAVHRAASALGHAVFERVLREPPAEGKDLAVFTAGASGTGKSSGLAAMPGLREQAHVVYDSTLSNRAGALRDVKAAREAGLRVSIIYTERELGEAFVATLARAREDGRPVTIETQLRTHAGAADTFQALRETYATDPNVELVVIRNTAAGREFVDVTAWQPRSYNEADARAQLTGILDAERQAGRVSPAVDEAVRGTRRLEGTVPGAPEAGARRVQSNPPSGRPSQKDAPLARPVGSGAIAPSTTSRAISFLQSGERQLRPSEIVNRLARDLSNLPIRVGRFRQRALGIYKPKEQVVRLKVANDLDTLAHEVGHHIHETVMGGHVPDVLYRDELERLGAPTSLGSYSLKQKLQEGQAEFTRLYLSDPPAAKKAAPRYYAAFEDGLRHEPELRAVLTTAQRQYVGHLSQDAATRGLARIDFSGQDPTPKKDFVTRLQTAVVDDLYPLQRMVEDLADDKPIDTSANGYALARLARGASAKADGFLRHGVRDVDGTFIAGPLERALQPVRKQAREFAAYLVASRVPELRWRGMETGMSLEEATAIRRRYESPTFDAARQAVYDYQDGLLQYAQRSKAMSTDQLAAMKQLNQHYVPFQRVLDDVGATTAGGKGPLANRVSPVKRIKGSGRDIINPLESIIRNTHTLVNMVEQNRAMLALVDQATATVGGGRFLERIPPKQLATMFNLDSVAVAIKDELQTAGVEIPDNLDFDRVVKVFTPASMPMGDRGVVTVLRDGKREWFSVNDQALFDAITAIAPIAPDIVVNLFMRPARMLRAGATTTLSFIARNPLRDTFEATVNSRYGFRLGYDTLKGLFEFAKKGEDYQNFLNSGAGNSALVAFDRNRIRKELADMSVRSRQQFRRDVVTSPIDLLRGVSEAMEHATRLGEFKRALDVEGRTTEGYARAALAARDVTIDFARGGTAAKQWNRYTAFFNAGVQGTARLAEVFSRDPVGASLRATAAITVPSLAIWVLNREDPEYRQLPEWERNVYWHLPIGRGAGHGWVKIPKPFTLGQVFANVPEAALDYLQSRDKAALERVLPGKSAAWHLAGSVIPTALLPFIEWQTNYDTFRDRAIVDPHDLGLDTELQYNRWTSELAKTVGPKIGLAPATLDHLIYGYGAGLAAGAVQHTESLASRFGLTPKKPTGGGPSRWPFTGAFYREAAGADAQSLADFYKLRDEIAGAKASITRYGKQQEPEKADARRQQVVTQLGGQADAIATRVSEADRLLKETRDAYGQIFVNRQLTPDEKKELLDRLTEGMINTARQGLDKPLLPSRFTKPPTEALLQKLEGGAQTSAR